MYNDVGISFYGFQMRLYIGGIKAQLYHVFGLLLQKVHVHGVAQYSITKSLPEFVDCMYSMYS